MPVIAARPVSQRRPSRASTTSHLPHWSEVPSNPRPSTISHLPHSSEVPSDPPRARPSPSVAAVLRDLVSWGADIAVLLTRGCPEDRDAIQRVRRYAYAWLAGESCPEVSIEDVLTTAAALMAGIDRNLGGTTASDDERLAIGAAVAA